MEAAHEGIIGPFGLWRMLSIKHGTKLTTSSGPDSMPSASPYRVRLWTGPLACRQAGDSVDKLCLTKGVCRFASAQRVFKAGEIGQRDAIPDFHRANRLLHPLYINNII